MVHIRTVKTSSGATAVQIVHSNQYGKRDIEHIGSAHSDAEVELLKVVARQRLLAGQGEFDFGFDEKPREPQPRIVASRAGLLWGAIKDAFVVLGLHGACGGDEVFFQLIAARIVEPTSELALPGLDCVDSGAELAGVDQAAWGVVGEVAEAEGDSAEVFEASVDGLCRCLDYAGDAGVCPVQGGTGRMFVGIVRVLRAM